MSTARSALRRRLFVCAALLAGLVCAELLLQIAYRVRQGRWLVESHAAHAPPRLVEFHPFLALVPRPGADITYPSGVRQTVLPDGTRSLGSAAAAGVGAGRTVVLLGGSSTFGYGVADEHTWAARLQERLGGAARVVNMGCLGHTTVEAVIQTAFLVPDRSPSVCVYYQGWNDARSMHVDRLDAAYADFHGRSQVSTIFGRGTRVRARTPSVLLFTLHDVVQRVSAAPDPWIAFRPVEVSREPVDAIDPRALALYRRNLRTLVALCRSQGVVAVMVPQVLDSDPPEGRSMHGWSPRVRDGYWRETISAYNGAMREVCGELDVRFASGVLDREWQDSEFIDVGHFSIDGNANFAELLEPSVRAALESSPSPR